MDALETGNVLAQQWEMELFLSVLSRTYIKLQTTFDRYFVMHGMTAQEASILVRCSEAIETSPGGLAFSLGRDKGQMSRFVQRLGNQGVDFSQGKFAARRRVHASLISFFSRFPPHPCVHTILCLRTAKAFRSRHRFRRAWPESHRLPRSPRRRRSRNKHSCGRSEWR